MLEKPECRREGCLLPSYRLPSGGELSGVNIWLIYFYPFQSHLKRLSIPELQIFGSNVTRSLNKKHERQIIDYHGRAPFLKLEKKTAKRTAVACFYKEKQMTFVAELLFKMVCGVPRSKRLHWFMFLM